MQKGLARGKSSLWGTEAVSGGLEGLALSSEPRYAIQPRVSDLQYPVAPGCVFGKLAASLALMKRGVAPGGPGRPADPGCEGLFGKRRLEIQSPDSQLAKKAN